MGYFSQIMIGNTLHYIRSKFEVEEKDIREIVKNSIIVPEDRREAYVKGANGGIFRGLSDCVKHTCSAGGKFGERACSGMRRASL